MSPQIPSTVFPIITLKIILPGDNKVALMFSVSSNEAVSA